MIKTLTLSLASLVVFGVLGFAPKTTLAYRGDSHVKGPNYNAERHTAMERAFENKDYNVWKELMQGRGRVMNIINEKNFARFAEAHALAKQGKFSEADAIRREFGLRTRAEFKEQRGFGRGKHCNC